MTDNNPTINVIATKQIIQPVTLDALRHAAGDEELTIEQALEQFEQVDSPLTQWFAVNVLNKTDPKWHVSAEG